MRDLLFKNLTSQDRRRRVVVTSEIEDKEGVHRVIHRHFLCMVREVADEKVQQPAPYVFILKEGNKKKCRQRFFCKIKGSIYAASNGKLYLIVFMHTLKISLSLITQNAMQQ